MLELVPRPTASSDDWQLLGGSHRGGGFLGVAVRLGTDLYRSLGRLAARSFGSIDAVVGVYARRSVAVGEVAPGRSDIDLHVLIADPASVDAEAELMLALAERLRLLRRSVRVLGHFDVSTRGELERWYAEQPAYWYRDRAWLHLWGDEFERPRTELEGARKDALLWQFFALWEQFTWRFRADDARRCSNVFLDMFDMLRLYEGRSREPLGRAELAELWYASGPPSRERTAIFGAQHRRVRAHPRETLEPLFRESLALHEVACRDSSGVIEGLTNGSLASHVPPSFSPRTILVIDPDDRAAVEAAIAAVRKDERVWPLPESAIRTYLTHRNPWEYAPLVAANPGLALAEPPADAFRRSVRIILYKELPRHFGFAGNHQLVGNLYAQRRLYTTDGIVVASAEELADAYRERFGVSPRTDGTQAVYFRTHYPRIQEVIDELRTVPGLAHPSGSSASR